MLMLKILIIEDDESLLKLYSIVLGKEGYETLLATNGQAAWDLIEKEHIDLIITDVMMPVMDGFEFVKQLRQYNSLIPVLMITAKDDFSSKSRGFNLGTDDYMVKPVDLNEMVLRVRALLRRANINTDRKLAIGGTVLDYDSLTVTQERVGVNPESSFGNDRNDSITGTESAPEPSMLPQKEFALLYKLLSYPGKIFTRIQLMDEIWGRESNSDLQTIDVHINRLRRRFEESPDFEIVTVRGLGYKAVVKS